MTENFVQKTLSTLLEFVEVEFKLQLGFAEIKFPVTAHAKKWWGNKKSRLEVEKAIQRAEEMFVAAHPNQKVAQMLHELPLYSGEEFKQVIAGLLTHLSEEKITWLAEVKLKTTWGNIASIDDIRKTLELYLPYLRHELNGIKEFREVISAMTLERVDKNAQETVEIVRAIKNDLKEVLKSRGEEKKDEPDFWFIPHPYPMPPNFTGRKTELEMLDNWLADNTNRLFILRALGGFGKSALAWQWLKENINPSQWTKLIWWSFYEGDASFEHFIEETLKYLDIKIPPDPRTQVDELLKGMQSQKSLCILDGFERILRLYGNMNAAYQNEEEHIIEDSELDCINTNAKIFLQGVCSLPNLKSKVLITTRLTPRAVKIHEELFQGSREETLKALQKEDAIEFFYKLKIKGTHAEIEATCSQYGYHPLTLRLLAGRVLKDFESPADIIVAQRLKIDGDIKRQKHHVLEVSYSVLPSSEQKLLSTIACFRSPIALDTLVSIIEKTDTLVDNLHDLVDRGLLDFDEKNKKFDLHPLVRRYAYEELPPSERIMIHGRLSSYFGAIKKPNPPKNLRDLQPTIEHFHHLARAKRFDDAWLLYRTQLDSPIFFQFGAYNLSIELLNSLFAENILQVRDEYKGSVFNALANSYSLFGIPKSDISLFEMAVKIGEQRSESLNLAIRLGNLAHMAQLQMGYLLDAEKNLVRAINICSISGSKYYKLVHQNYLGLVLIYQGLWFKAKNKFEKVNSSLRENYFINETTQGQCLALAYLALNELQHARYQLLKLNSADFNIRRAIQLAERSLSLAEKTKKTDYPYERDFVRAHWLLGAAYRLDSIGTGSIISLTTAENHLSEALVRDRIINLVESEADILLDIARLRYDKKKYEEAKSLADEALSITERCGYVLQGADVNLFLAQYALEQEQDKVKAKAYAEEAKKLATCDGPPYYYKVAYEEAERFLEMLKAE